MIAHADQRLALARDRIARDHRHAAETHLAREARQRHRLSLRHRASRRLIQLGEWLAAEPTART